jgi:HAD superfamily hydrolase (TIGR01509 family)
VSDSAFDYPFDALLFDMDGLLVDTEPLWLETESEVMAWLGGQWTEADQQALLGGSMARTVAYLLSKATRPVPPGQVAAAMMEGMLARAAAGRVVTRPGARELLAGVMASGVPYALVTSSERDFADAVLAASGFRFPVMVTGDDVTAHKPDPEPYLLAARLLGVDPARCVALEDSPAGVASAGRAGCLVIAVPSLLPIQAAAGIVVMTSLAEVNMEVLRVVPGRAGMSSLRRAASMSGYSSVFWLALCTGLTALGLVLTVLIGRRRSVRAMLHGAAWSLIPIAAYLTGSTQMFWRIGEAIGTFATSFAFSTVRWAGIGVAGLIVVLFLAGGGRQRRKAAKAARAARAAGRAEKDTAQVVPSGAAGAVTSGAKGTEPTGRQAEPVPIRRGRAGEAPAGKGSGKAMPTGKTAPAGKAVPADNDLADIEEILRNRGILPGALE